MIPQVSYLLSIILLKFISFWYSQKHDGFRYLKGRWKMVACDITAKRMNNSSSLLDNYWCIHSYVDVQIICWFFSLLHFVTNFQWLVDFAFLEETLQCSLTIYKYSIRFFICVTSYFHFPNFCQGLRALFGLICVTWNV